jgi:peptidoglycan/xylan/chitin deacetylase (PgdA/CDA1 family)
MWRFYITLAIFVLVAVAFLVFPVTAVPVILLLALDLLVMLATIAFGAFKISSQFFVKAFCRGDPASNQVAISFDDGPNPIRSPEILEILDRYQCKASFFLIGKNIERNEGLVRQMKTAGHTIGCHSFSHSRWFPFFPAGRISREIGDTNRLIEQQTGEKVRYFRPPFGVTNPNVRKGLRNSGLRVIGWSIRSFDTQTQSADKVINRITGRLEGGDVILLHETSECVMHVLEQLLPRIREMGLNCVSLDQMMEMQASGS